MITSRRERRSVSHREKRRRVEATTDQFLVLHTQGVSASVIASKLRLPLDSVTELIAIASDRSPEAEGAEAEGEGVNS